VTDVSAAPPSRFEPPMSDAAKPFWDATRDQQLQLPWCRSCRQFFWYPRELCPRCLGDDIDWRAASGKATVYACSIMPKPAHPSLAERVPYVVALVDLDEGPRLMTNVVGCDPADVKIGMAVQVTWEALNDGRHLPVFEPAAKEG
jgi:uncharacterized OB-fold protein